jgi:predicted PurR-regulated permease PerM
MEFAVARTARWSLRLLVIAAVLVLALYVLGRLWTAVLPACLALVLATILWPPTRLLRRVLPPAASAGLVILVGVALLAGTGAALVAVVVSQKDELADATVNGLEDLQDWTTRPPLNLGDDQLGTLVDRSTNQVQEHAQDIAAFTLSGVTTAGSLTVTAVLAVVICFFLLKDGPAFLPWASEWLPERGSQHIREMSLRLWAVVGDFIKAQALVGLADAIGIGLGLVVLGVPLAVPLAVLTFVGAFIPIIGAFITGALAALVALVTAGPTTALLVVALIVLVQQLESNVLSPMLMGRALRLHPGMVIVVVTAGSSLFGVAGAFLAVPALAIGTTMARYAREQVHQKASSTA